MSVRIPFRMTVDDRRSLDVVRSAYALDSDTAALRKSLCVAMAFQFEDPSKLVPSEHTGETRPFVFRATDKDCERLLNLWQSFTAERGQKLRLAVRLAARFSIGCMTPQKGASK